MFNTVVSTAGLDATASGAFEKEFYGRAETDLKFLASHAIGQRAKAVGETNPGNGEGEQKTDAAKALAMIEKTATDRFNAEPKLRRMFGVPMSSGQNDPGYKAAMTRYVALAQKQAADEAAQKPAPAE